MFTTELQGVHTKCWNSERAIVFAAVVLQKCSTVQVSGDIRRRISQRLDLWDESKWKALVDDVEGELLSKTPQWGQSLEEESIACAYNARVLSGRLWSTVRFLMSRSEGGVMQLDKVCTKKGQPVVTKLWKKHPPLQDPPTDDPTKAFKPYDEIPKPVSLIVTEDTVANTVSKLSGAAGP